MQHYFFSKYIITTNFSGNVVLVKNAFIKFETLICFGFCAMPAQNEAFFKNQ